MPLNKKGQKIMKSMKKTYGKEAEAVFYAKSEQEKNQKVVEDVSILTRIRVILCLLSLLLLLTLEAQWQKLKELTNHSQEKFKY